MEETIKTRIILILSILSIILFIGTISSCGNAYRQKVARDKEMAKRLDLEERMSRFSQEKLAQEEKSRAQEKELEEEKAAHQATKNALVQEQLVNQSLKEELQKVSKLKEALEEDLKEALVTAKSTKSKK
jgi:adenylosuccinate synthase